MLFSSVEINTIYLNLLKRKYTSATVYPKVDTMHCEAEKCETN